MVQPDIVMIPISSIAATQSSTHVDRPTPLAQNSTQTNNTTQSTVTKLVKEFRDLKLFLVQGQNFRNKSHAQECLVRQRSVQFVTCHGCGKKGHYKFDCPDNGNARTLNVGGIAPSRVKLAEVNLLEFVSNRVDNPTPEVMMAKHGRPMLDIEPPIRKHHKISKGRLSNTSHASNKTDKQSRRRIGIEDMIISKGQQDYSIITDLGKQPTNIIVSQLIARCPFLKRELRQGISIKRPT